MLVGVMAGLGAGVARAIARTANASVAGKFGVARSTFYNFVVGLVCSIAALLVAGDARRLPALLNAQVPQWAYFGGLVGVLFVVCSSLAATRMSAFVMTLLLLVGQVTAGIVLDAVLRGQVAPLQVVGGALLFAGLLWDAALGRRKPVSAGNTSCSQESAEPRVVPRWTRTANSKGSEGVQNARV